MHPIISATESFRTLPCRQGKNLAPNFCLGKISILNEHVLYQVKESGYDLTWSNPSTCSTTLPVRPLVSSLEAQVVVPASHTPSHGCQHHQGPRSTFGDRPNCPDSHEGPHGHRHEQDGQLAHHGKNSRSACPTPAARSSL